MPGPFVPASEGGVVSAPAERVFDIAVIPGDGIGVEVIPEGLRVLERLAEQSDGRLRFRFESFPWGSQYFLQTGRMMDPDGLERLQRFDAIYFGAVGWPDVPDHISLWGLRLAICQGFDQYACVRPVRLLPGVPSPLRDATPERIDWVVVRENSEGEYAGIGGRNLAARGPQSRGGDPDGPLYRRRLRADHPLRVRAGAHTEAAEGDQRHQEQRPAVWDGALGRGIRPRPA